MSCSKPGPAGKWSVIETGKPDNTVFEMNFLTPESGWLSTWSGDGPKETEGWEVLSTIDGGKTWNVLADQAKNKIKQVYFINGKSGWALTLTNDILATKDGGTTWELQRKAGKVKVKYNYNNPTAPTETRDPITKLKFYSEKRGWAWGGGRQDDSYEQEGIFLRTEDGGKTWEKADYSFSDELKTVYFLDADLGWVSDRKGGLYRTVDGGKSWQKDPEDIKQSPINAFFFIDLNKGWGVGSNGYVGRTTDGGKTWIKGRAGKSFLNSVFFVDEKVGWVAGENGEIFRTEDGGLKWERQESSLPATLTHLQFFGNRQGWAAGNAGYLLRYEGLR
ncbi:MAG: hypothetical protein JNN15_01805 [Blastocatellia bacterium]|nr:hypothetical protein [Blastocatellia bacterium]